MANNRIWLVCSHCKDEYLLAKYYPTITNGWFLPLLWSDARLEGFLQKHSYCPSGVRTMYGNIGFQLRFEEST